MARLIVETLFSNGLKMSEYEAYQLTDFPLIVYWACDKNNYGVISQIKLTNKYKEKLLTLYL